MLKIEENLISSSIRKWARFMGLKRCKAIRKPFINERARSRRLQWACDYQGFNWKKVMFSDEAAMQNGGVRNIFVTRAPKEEFEADCLAPKFRKLQSCMVWGAIGWNYKSTLVFWDHSLGSMKSGGYLEHILPIVRSDIYFLEFSPEEWSPGSWRFMQDNAPIHTAKICQNWLVEKDIETIHWPASSPDMNPIENLWAIIKGKLSQKRTEGMDLRAFKALIQAEWDAISLDYINTLIQSMPARTAALIRAQGGHTKY